MSEMEVSNLKDRIRSLKQKIHDNEERLAVAEGPEQAARLYEALFSDLRAWIKSEGTAKEIADMQPIIREFGSIKREQVTEEASTIDFNPSMIYTIENDESTEVEVYIEVAPESKLEMVRLSWRRLEEKRIDQYQKLKEIFGHKFKSDEVLHDPKAHARDIV